MKVFVTGASGFLGSHLTAELTRRGCRVRALIRRQPGSSEPALHPSVEWVSGDIINADDVLRASEGCSHFYHIAALYRSAKEKDKVYYDVNMGGTKNVLNAARRHGAVRVVHCSTVGVHGDVAEIPANESSALLPHDVYQRSKLEGEKLAHSAAQEGLPVTIFRPAAIYGPGDTRFLKLFRSIRSGRFRMIGSGAILYHMVFISDLVEGVLLCGEHPAALGQTYILAGPRYSTLAELAGLVAEAVGRPLARGHIPLAPLKLAARLCEASCRPFGIDPPLHRRRLDFFSVNRAFSIEKARREIGYSPKVDIEEGCRLTAQWYFESGLLKQR